MPQSVQLEELTVVWEKLPDDFVLPDDPVENIYQPFLAAALTEALDLAGRVTSEGLIASNMGICVRVNDKIVVKAPDWFYVPRVSPVNPGEIRRSYTPHRDGDVPLVVMEFLSETETGEYSIRPTYPYGKLWFYERILQVPIYVIFDPGSGMLEVRQLVNGRYEVQPVDAQGRYFIPSLGLSLGVWFGKRLEMQTHWLRWWDEAGLLLWGSERITQERERAEQERERAEQERKRADAAQREVERLRALLEAREAE